MTIPITGKDKQKEIIEIDISEDHFCCRANC